MSDTVVSSQEDRKRNREGSKSEERREEKKQYKKEEKKEKISQEGRITRGCFHVLKKSSHRRRSVSCLSLRSPTRFIRKKWPN